MHKTQYLILFISHSLSTNFTTYSLSNSNTSFSTSSYQPSAYFSKIFLISFSQYASSLSKISSFQMLPRYFLHPSVNIIGIVYIVIVFPLPDSAGRYNTSKKRLEIPIKSFVIIRLFLFFFTPSTIIFTVK